MARRTTGAVESRAWGIEWSCFRRTTCVRTCDATRRTALTPKESWRPAATRTFGRFRSRPSSQQVLTSLHRLRSGWMSERTARINCLRGLLRELGFFIPAGARQVIPAVWALVEDADADVPDTLRPFLAELCQEIREIEARVDRVEKQLQAMSQQLPVVAQLMTIPGVGLLTATALLAFIGDIRRFPSARHLASYLGLTPREYSSGLRRYLGRISKRGDGYLRTLLIHGARSVLLHARTKQPDRLREWAHHIANTHVHNKAAVAVANKLARVVWAVWTHAQPYQPQLTA